MSTAPRQSVHTDPVVRAGRRTVAVHPATDPFTALTVMRRNEVRHLPVVEGDRCVGLLSEGHLLAALASTNGSGDQRTDGGLNAGALCHRPAPTVPPGSSLQAMAAIMTAERVDAVLVVHRGELVGIVTGSDVLGAITGGWPAAAEVPEQVSD